MRLSLILIAAIALTFGIFVLNPLQKTACASPSACCINNFPFPAPSPSVNPSPIPNLVGYLDQITNQGIGCTGKLPQNSQPAYKSAVSELGMDADQEIAAIGNNGLSYSQGIQAMQALIDQINSACDIANQNGSTPVPGQGTTGISVPVPDPIEEFRGAPLLVMADGKTRPPGANNAERVRNYLAELFERWTRVFVAGTDQLKIDTGIPFKIDPTLPTSLQPSPTPSNEPVIKGMYQGYMPDLLNSIPNQILQGSFNPEWVIDCAAPDRTGTVNKNNAQKKWFKSASGNYDESITGFGTSAGAKITNHICGPQGFNGVTPKFPEARGDIVDQLMNLMKTMQNDLKKGAIKSPDALVAGALDSCALLRAELFANRKAFSDPNNPLNPGLMHLKDQFGMEPPKSTLDCATDATVEDDDQRHIANKDQVRANYLQGKLGSQAEIRSCKLAAIQVQIEVNLVLRYAYCVWRSAAEKTIDEMLNYYFNTAQSCSPQDSEPWVAAGASPFNVIIALLLALILGAASSGCNNNTATATCVGGFKYPTGIFGTKWIHRYFGQQKQGVTRGTAPDGTILDFVEGGSQSTTFPDDLPPNTNGTINMCGYSCLGAKERMNQIIAQNNKTLSDPKLDPAFKQRIVDQNNRLPTEFATALSDCQALHFDAYKGGATAININREVFAENCQCKDPFTNEVPFNPDGSEANIYQETKEQFPYVALKTTIHGYEQVADDQLPRLNNPAAPLMDAATAGGERGTSIASRMRGDTGNDKVNPGGLAPAKQNGGLARGSMPSAGNLDLSNVNPGAPPIDSAAATAGNQLNESAGEYAAAGAPNAGGDGKAKMGNRALASADAKNVLGEANFGAPGTAVDPMGTPDPEDYFTRTGLAESLFKKVEKVYRRKATIWAATDVKK